MIRMNKRDKLEVGIEKAYQRFENAVEKAASTRLGFLFNLLDSKPKTECLGNIICECNKRSCPARTVSVYTYCKRMRELEHE